MQNDSPYVKERDDKVLERLEDDVYYFSNLIHKAIEQHGWILKASDNHCFTLEVPLNHKGFQLQWPCSSEFYPFLQHGKFCLINVPNWFFKDGSKLDE